MRPHGRARVDPSSPRAWGTCDRCGFNHNLENLTYQFQYAGTGLINTRLRVCSRCLDVPSEFLRTIVLPPDPLPVHDPRPEPYTIDETDYRVTEDGDTRITEDGDTRIVDDGT